MKPGLTVDFDTHWNTCHLLPVCTHMRAVCSDESCGAEHGWLIELGWLWWSFTFECLVDPEAL